MNENNVSINCLAFQLSQARKKVMKWYESYLKPLGLNSSYVYVMEVIKENGPLNLSSIARELDLEKATVSNLLGRMERDGYIIRLPGVEKRSMEVSLTEKGDSVLEEALNALRNSDQQLDEMLKGQLEEIKGAIGEVNQIL